MYVSFLIIYKHQIHDKYQTQETQNRVEITGYLAVGHLFSLLHNQSKAVVVCTHTGHVIQEFCPPAGIFTDQQDMYCLHSPVEENRLNTISCDLKRVILPMVKGGWYDPELSIVVSLS